MSEPRTITLDWRVVDWTIAAKAPDLLGVPILVSAHADLEGIVLTVHERPLEMKPPHKMAVERRAGLEP